mmetsp:Transcript_9864/g.15816  ORF Transcript_9864/g.15816 Transcript_9864/m.15816 type:complete len:102 (+) Transcript_9864:49-354(+)
MTYLAINDSFLRVLNLGGLLAFGGSSFYADICASLIFCLGSTLFDHSFAQFSSRILGWTSSSPSFVNISSDSIFRPDLVLKALTERNSNTVDSRFSLSLGS